MESPLRINVCRHFWILCFLMLVGEVRAQSDRPSLELPLDTVPDKAGDRLFQSIDNISEDSWVVRGLSDLILSSPQGDRLFSDSVQVVDRMKYFRKYEGKTVRALRFLRLDPFGASIDDTIAHPLTWIERTGNAIRTKTREQKIRNYALFKVGDRVNPFRFLDTEALLRALDYLQDARIYIQGVPKEPGKVDVVVVTHDVWPIAVELDFPHLNTGQVEAWHRNFLGWGLNVQQGVYWGPTKYKKYGYVGSLGLDNIYQSMIDAEIHYTNKYEKTSYGASLTRDFSTPFQKYGGYISYEKEKVSVDYYFQGVQLGLRDDIYTTLRFSAADVWLARSFSLPTNPRFPDSRRNITLSTRVYGLTFQERPADLKDEYYPLQNKTLYLGSLTYTKQQSHLTQLLYSYGRSEDVPSGRSGELILGHEAYEQSNRFYVGARAASGRFIGRFGYMYANVVYGLFFNGEGTQGTWKMSWNYFTPLMRAGRSQSRTFFSGSYTYGFRSSTFEYLTLNGKEGIAGFRNDSLRGNQRLLLHWETNFFMPKKLYGFRFVLFTSGNLGWINDDKKVFTLSGKMYSSIGVGMRVRNDHLAFSTFQFRFSWFPSMSKGSRVDWFEFSRSDKLRLPQFKPTAPEAIWLN